MTHVVEAECAEARELELSRVFAAPGRFAFRLRTDPQYVPLWWRSKVLQHQF
ncbi:hypothetical protein SAMN05444161_6439 [Rhizobiales bacterium GAS191]|nr:hypothetical protein SAMN05519103_05614 [Rhizobiales bacterium GAS113]SEE62907.1 hypothetical protein SAMN05444161_6439 [Rhizobiales bacterium GAS191]